MKNKSYNTSLILCLIVFFASFTLDLAHAEKESLIFNSGCYPGPYFPLAEAISKIANEKVPDIKITVDPVTSAVISAKMIARGDADFGIVRNDIAFYALKGAMPLFDKPVPNIRGVASLYTEYVQIMARKDAKIASIQDLKGKRVSVGPRGSAEEQSTLQILEAYGMRFEDLAKVKWLTVGQSASSLIKNEIDAFFYVIGIGYGPIKAAASKIQTVIVPIDDAHAEILIKNYPYYVKNNVLPGIYKGIDNPVPALSIMTMVATKSNLNDNIVYQITKAMFEDTKSMGWAHGYGKQVKLKNALVGMSVPLHPGAKKFYKEKGIIK